MQTLKRISKTFNLVSILELDIFVKCCVVNQNSYKRSLIYLSSIYFIV